MPQAEPASVAPLPCRLREGELEVLLVSSRIDGSWGLAERSLPPGESGGQRAADAAYSAAGVRGPCVAWRRCPRRSPRLGARPKSALVEVYLLHVTREVERYPERGKRRRAWLPLAEACQRLARQPELSALVAGLEARDLPELPRERNPQPWRRRRDQPPIVCLDLDDTILTRGDEPLPGAVAACEVLAARGCRLVVSTARLDPIWAGSPRAGRIQARLEELRFPIAQVCADVPPADLYVDDKGWPFTGNWEALLDEARARLARGGRLRLSLALAGCLMGPTGEPLPGARETHAELRSLGAERIISLGNFRPELTPDERVSAARAWLTRAGIDPSRVHPGKVSSHLYVDAHAQRFTGSWQATLPAVLARLT